MQFTNKAALDDNTKVAPTSVPAQMAEDLNGGSSAELHELLGALQAMRVGDFSVRGGIKTVVTAEYTSDAPSR